MRQQNPHKNPILLAYILFIVVCLIRFIICRVTGGNFELWDRIVVAVTMTSYFFSINSLNKLMLRQEEINKDFYLDEVVFLQRIQDRLKVENDPVSERIDELKAKCRDEHEKTIKSITKRSKVIFVFDVIGYLVFFLLMVLDGVTDAFTSSTDFYTLLAFLVILVVEYTESTKIAWFEQLRKDTKEKSRELVETEAKEN